MPLVKFARGMTHQKGSAACVRVRQHGLQALLLVLYIVADAGKMFLVVWANNGRSAQHTFLPSSLLLVQLCVSAVIALGISGLQVGSKAVYHAMHPRNVASCMPVSALFFLSKTSTIAALAYVDAGTVKLSTQLILPCTAVLSVWLIQGSRYTVQQWISILAICMGTLAFHAVQIEAEGQAHADSGHEWVEQRQKWVTGLSLCGIVVLANSFGSVVGERFLKKGKDTPLACLKAQLVLAELCVISMFLLCYERPRSCKTHIFEGWDWRVLACSLGWVPSTWMSTIITARFSTVVKNVMQCISTLITYFMAVVLHTGQRHTLGGDMVALMVIMTIGTLTLQQGPKEEEEEEDDLEDGDDASWTKGYQPFINRAVTEVPSPKSPKSGAGGKGITWDSPEKKKKSPRKRKRESWRRVEDVLDLAVIAEGKEFTSFDWRKSIWNSDGAFDRATTV